MRNKKNTSFNFGVNWKNFSEKSLDAAKLNSALDSLNKLIGKDKIKNSSFLDIGCGSGIFTIAAAKIGAKELVGVDISKESIEASLSNEKKFLSKNKIRFLNRSVFGKDFLGLGLFDIVYSWGVLHHTGNMWKAIDTSSKLVKKNGLFVIAIYNKHWSSPMWNTIKFVYNKAPKLFQYGMVGIFYGSIALARLLITRKNPFAKKRRGMSFYHDVIDWIGGYPYEYASKKEIQDFIENKGFKLNKFVKAPIFTGCNEFVFERLIM